jgi:hypothetical protein
LTSDHVGLGESDANYRWIGIRRHQAVLVVLGVGLCSEWLLSPSAPSSEFIVALTIMTCAVPTYDGLTVGEQLVVALRYIIRSHWSAISALEFGDDIALWANGDVAFRGYELDHRGRLDLSGRDVINAEALQALADAAGATRAGQHFSEHVFCRDDHVSTLLALPIGVPAPDGWLKGSDLARRVIGFEGDATSLRLLERFSYVRAPEQLVRVYRVRDFSSVPSTRGLLDQVLKSSTPLDLALHVDVVSGARAQRLSARAVHRVGSDDATSRAVGFRRTARATRNFERLAQREGLVASGRALVRVAVFLLVRAPSLEELHQRGDALWRHAHDAGLRLERGRGLQARWYRAQLPGGPSW